MPQKPVFEFVFEGESYVPANEETRAFLEKTVRASLRRSGIPLTAENIENTTRYFLDNLRRKEEAKDTKRWKDFRARKPPDIFPTE